MTRFVVDAPTLLALVAADRPIDPAHQLVAPAGIRSQALDLLLAQVAAGELTDTDALDAHERVTETKLRALNDRVSRSAAFRLAREHGWDTVRDAEYLAVARLQADALVTVSDELAARAAGLVPTAPFDALFAP